jgi:NAD-dependent deacetylase
LTSCDALVVVGTWGGIPAAGFVEIAKEHGAQVVEINPERTPLTDVADVFVAGGARTILPALAAQTR